MAHNVALMCNNNNVATTLSSNLTVTLPEHYRSLLVGNIAVVLLGNIATIVNLLTNIAATLTKHCIYLNVHIYI